MALFSVRIISDGIATWAEMLRNNERVTAINNEAGTPLPDTSPIQKISFSSRM